MSRVLTTWRRPSIEQMLATAGTIEGLANMREEILRSTAAGELQASPKTLRRWEEALWVRVLELMARHHDRAQAIFDAVAEWPRPPRLAEALQAQLTLCTATSNPAPHA